MSPCEFAALITSIACCISKGKSQEEIEVLAAFFAQLGDTLATIAVYGSNCCCKSSDETGSEEEGELGSLL